MDVFYNNIPNPLNMVTFTEIPNILSVKEYMSGTKATFTFTFNDGLRQTVTADSQYYVTFLGETVTNVMDAKNATNKRFFISSSADGTAMSFARALRNCASLAADFDIINKNANVYLIGKTIGQKWSNTADYLQRNIPNNLMGASGTDGNAYSVLFNSKIDVDVYSGDSSDYNNYVTTLEKNYYGDECAFDVSPILATMSEYGRTKPYTFDLQLIREDGEWQHIGQVSGNTVIGYHANQSDKYKTAQGVEMLLNKRRGSDGVMTLYTYSNDIPCSILCGQNTGGWTITLSVKDSAFQETFSTTFTGHRTSSNYIIDETYTVPSEWFQNAYYIDITLGSDTTRFNVIKPLRATEYYQRILWRNEYGGISFFDFTGARTETDNVEIETYEKNVFDYHDFSNTEEESFERKMIYDNKYVKTVSLTSHLMEEDGKWIFNSLMRSKKVWTTVNGKKYFIIPKSIDVTEDQAYNNIYTAKLTYEYSDI